MTLFFVCSPFMRAKKLSGIDEHICIISMLGNDPSTVVFENSFSIGDKKSLSGSDTEEKTSKSLELYSTFIYEETY